MAVHSPSKAGLISYGPGGVIISGPGSSQLNNSKQINAIIHVPVLLIIFLIAVAVG
jgi:hypothetical protein